MYSQSKIKTASIFIIFVFFAGIVLADPAQAAGCGGTSTRIIQCGGESGLPAIKELIRIAVIAMTAVIGIVATGGLAYAAVVYSSARDSQVKVDQAKTIIRNVVIGIAMYGFMVAIVAWLVPGSVIG